MLSSAQVLHLRSQRVTAKLLRVRVRVHTHTHAHTHARICAMLQVDLSQLQSRLGPDLDLPELNLFRDATADVARSPRGGMRTSVCGNTMVQVRLAGWGTSERSHKRGLCGFVASVSVGGG